MNARQLLQNPYRIALIFALPAILIAIACSTQPSPSAPPETENTSTSRELPAQSDTPADDLSMTLASDQVSQAPEPQHPPDQAETIANETPRVDGPDNVRAVRFHESEQIYLNWSNVPNAVAYQIKSGDHLISNTGSTFRTFPISQLPEQPTFQVRALITSGAESPVTPWSDPAPVEFFPAPTSW